MTKAKPLKVFIAGPYTPSDSDLHDASRVAHRNTIKAIKAGIKLIERGHIPFIPHLTHFIHLETEKPLPAEFYYRYDMVWLQHCDALLYLGNSEGANKELQKAKELGLEIFYSIEKVPEARRHGHSTGRVLLAQRHSLDKDLLNRK